MKRRLILLVAAVFILRALGRRRRARALDPEASPANDLRAKLDETRTDVEEQAGEAKDSASEAVADATDTADELRADVHARARQAIDELS